MGKEDFVGKKIRVIHMEDEPQFDGKTGIVKSIDSLGQLHGTWGWCGLSDARGDKWEVID